MPQKRMVMVAALVAALTILAWAPSVLAGKVSNVRQDISQTVVNICNGEEVDLEGTGHYVISTTQNANRLSLKANVNIHLTGIGENTGSRYVFNQNSQQIKNFTVDTELTYPYVLTEKLRYRLVSQGSQGNDYLTAMFHMTVNANGNITAYIDTIDWECSPQK